jgi:hypothetical protein
MMNEVPSAPTLASLLAQQREQWQLGKRIPVETYLQRHVSLAGDADVVLDLIGNELLLRLELGERPLLAEYLERFPQWSAELTIQFQVEIAGEAEARRTEQRPFRNSWGSQWGQGGYGLMSYAYARAFANDAMWLEFGLPGSEEPVERFEAETLPVSGKENCDVNVQDMSKWGGPLRVPPSWPPAVPHPTSGPSCSPCASLPIATPGPPPRPGVNCCHYPPPSAAEGSQELECGSAAPPHSKVASNCQGLGGQASPSS